MFARWHDLDGLQGQSVLLKARPGWTALKGKTRSIDAVCLEMLLHILAWCFKTYTNVGCNTQCQFTVEHAACELGDFFLPHGLAKNWKDPATWSWNVMDKIDFWFTLHVLLVHCHGDADASAGKS